MEKLRFQFTNDNRIKIVNSDRGCIVGLAKDGANKWTWAPRRFRGIKHAQKWLSQFGYKTSDIVKVAQSQTRSE